MNTGTAAIANEICKGQFYRAKLVRLSDARPAVGVNSTGYEFMEKSGCS